ncbi:MAG: hypothetical protein WC748_09790 [Legionellales bacterium]|jgi:hypothetical protein
MTQFHDNQIIWYVNYTEQEIIKAFVDDDDNDDKYIYILFTSVFHKSTYGRKVLKLNVFDNAVDAVNSLKACIEVK